MQNASLLLGWVGPKPALLPFFKAKQEFAAKEKAKNGKGATPKRNEACIQSPRQ